MGPDRKKIEEIDEYLSGELTPEHRNDFEKKLQDDTNLQQDLQTTKKVIDGVQGHAFKKMLKNIHSKHFNKKAEE
jgi:anti-sigma factor RsiW